MTKEVITKCAVGEHVLEPRPDVTGAGEADGEHGVGT